MFDMRPRDEISHPLSLAPSRMHEAFGGGRRAFGLFQAASHPGPVVWIIPDYMPERLMLTGLPRGVNERLTLVTPSGHPDLLWCVEEALRASPVGLVVAEPQVALSLTQGRRFQLAAEAGGTTGIMLTREGGGCNSTETRWFCESIASKPDSTLVRWSLNKNKKGTIGSWVVDWNGETAAFNLVSDLSERYQPAEAPD